jgi:5-methylthioadenosine/S-adenosylhomocysteine deaminase
MRSENVESIMHNGEWVMRDKTILTVNEAEVIEGAKRRAGIRLPDRFSVVDDKRFVSTPPH